jgi:hypothetical protein
MTRLQSRSGALKGCQHDAVGNTLAVLYASFYRLSQVLDFQRIERHFGPRSSGSEPN